MNTESNLIVSVLMMAAMFGAIVMALRSLFRKSGASSVPRVDDSTRSVVTEDVSSRTCVCGDVATEPMPELRRSRGTLDFLRKFYAAPPRYIRYIDRNSPPMLCRIHAHVADAKMEEFLHVRVRGVFSEAYAKVAIEAASFEKESLLKTLNDSLTDREKKSLRRPTSNVVSIAANGTDGRDSQN